MSRDHEMVYRRMVIASRLWKVDTTVWSMTAPRLLAFFGNWQRGVAKCAPTKAGSIF